MTEENVKSILMNLIIEYANETISAKNSSIDKYKNVNLIEELGYDSVSLMQLIIAIEDRFNIETDNDVLIENFDNFENIYNYVVMKIKEF